MDSDLIHDRGRGPEIAGTRITVYNLLPYFLDPTATEEYVCQIYELTPEQVAAGRAYVLLHFEDVMRMHRQIEERLNQPNPPQVLEQMAKSNFLAKFAEWKAAKANGQRTMNQADAVPPFHEWVRTHQ